MGHEPLDRVGQAPPPQAVPSDQVAALFAPSRPTQGQITDIDNRFDFHPADADRGERHAAVRAACKAAAEEINELCPDGREKSLAITHLEEAMMWGNAAIARG